jgi:hypothetical protein
MGALSSSQVESAPEVAGVKGAFPQTTDKKRTVSRTRKKLARISRIARRVIPEELAACEDVQRVADDWNTYPYEVRDSALFYVLREVKAIKDRMERDRARVVPIRTGRAA